MILEVKDLSCSFDGVSVLRNLNLSAGTGQIIGVIGPNGCGKTTLFNCISGFVEPDSGDVFLSGKKVSHMPPYARARLGLGRVFQNFGIFKELSLLENMLVGLENQAGIFNSLLPWSRVGRELREKAMQGLEQIGLADKANQKAASLSGGQMRLLEIVRTVLVGSNVFLLDEPTAGVSPKMKSDISDMLTSLRDETRVVLIIEHDINFIQSFCDRILVINSGRVELDDTPECVIENPLLAEIYFGRKDTAKTQSSNA